MAFGRRQQQQQQQQHRLLAWILTFVFWQSLITVIQSFTTSTTCTRSTTTTTINPATTSLLRPTTTTTTASTTIRTTRFFYISATTTTKAHRLQKMSSSSSSSATTQADSSYMAALSQAVSASLGRSVTLEPCTGGGYSGGGGATTSAVMDPSTNTKYFVKAAAASGGGGDMLQAEYTGLKEMADTNTIRVPTPIAFGNYENKAFAIFEYLEFTGGGSQYELGQQLAKMHRCMSPNKSFGFHVDNTIGATPQPNLPWMDNWADFWDTHRLGHMLRLTGNANLPNTKVEELRQKTRALLSHNPAPSLLHGDLWGGNKGFCKDNNNNKAASGGSSSSKTVVPVIFDPATYYGDREADVAMTYVFGGFNGDFYKGYEDEWPLPEGHEQRRTVYNLYHILNHQVLFGGGYLSQARGMIDRILRS